MDKPAYLRSKFRTKCFSIDETKTNKDAFAYLNLPIWEPLDEVWGWGQGASQYSTVIKVLYLILEANKYNTTHPEQVLFAEFSHAF